VRLLIVLGLLALVVIIVWLRVKRPPDR